jgi:hypothetical protein
MTFQTPLRESAHRNLTRFDSDVATRVQAGALEASTMRAYVRKQPPKRHDSACSHDAAVTQAHHDERGHQPVSCCTHRPNCFSRQTQTQWLARKCSEVLALVYEK